MTDDPEWHAVRSKGIGASEVAAAWSGKYGGGYGVVAKKLGKFESTINPELADRGHRWEHRVADAVTVLHGLYVVGEQTWCEHPDHPHRRATVDGFLSPTPEATPDQLEALLEIKTVGVHSRPAWDYYNAQVQFGMHVTGTVRACVAVATIDDADDDLKALRLSWVDADPDLQNVLAELADRLWEHVQAGTYPEPDTPESLDVVRQRFATSDDDAETVDLTDLAEIIARHKAIREAEKAAGDELRILEARIRDALGHARRGHADGWNVTLSAPARVVTAAAEDAFLQVHPDCWKRVLDRTAAETVDKQLLDELREPVGARTLRITRKKET